MVGAAVPEETLSGVAAALFLPTPGSVFRQHYRVRRAIAAGGAGAVYEVVDERTGSRRALKVLLPDRVTDPEARERFAQEARITANLRSDHLVDTLDVGTDAATGLPFIVLDLVEGEALGTISARRGPLPFDEVVAIARQIALGLDRLHAAGIVHRDVTPGNVIVGRAPDGAPRVKLVDYGTAKFIAESTTYAKTTLALGTPLYMAPEQIEGDGSIDGRADVYALAHVVYTLLVGEPYFDPRRAGRGRGFAILVTILRGLTELPSERAARAGASLPRGFDAWFGRVAARSRDARPGWASEAIADLARIATSPERSLPALDVAMPVAASGRGAGSRRTAVAAVEFTVGQKRSSSPDSSVPIVG